MLLANRGFNNLFDDMFKDPFFTRPYDNSSSQIMKTDIHDKDGNYIIEMETASTRNAIPELATEVSM